ncbi:MAG TPA: chemotaxis response regulator protein-glutamate methylesterase [Oligoflexus sp.]|uniref:protein-glutamate methylesterase/protein-glutamine glutaminase n=1 Tax=Oligoflexus sp. TaxID=1971216 RepID=UPI002D5068A3|nr:chemotaxis response regulator protein-glutamate methylesterase [Oligoflexus sp.]HYX38179.1 chemotaxis response regulator protein-glutamate methylesterase [Oligoflexus sp.]
MAAKIRCLIVDDSAIVRSVLQRMLNSDPEIEVVGSAPDPYVAREKLIELQPDVMTLDIEMPRMDGLTFLEKVMAAMPIRTLIISSLAREPSEMALRALEVGAIDVLAKPAINVTDSLHQMREDVITRVKAVARARLHPRIKPKVDSRPTLRPSQALGQTTHQILAMAASTGGTEALKVVLRHLPPDIPGTLIVQHMPPVFTRTFAENLNRICSFEVKEAEDGDRVKPGLVLLAPGNYHMELTRSGAYYYVKLNQDPAQHGVRPAADIMLRSVARYAGKNAVGVVLTGMGRDGAQGLLEMRQTGAYTIAQDEPTSVVYGMPKAALEIGGIDKVLPLGGIAPHLIREFQKRDLTAS